jgi:hypothetical protein
LVQLAFDGRPWQLKRKELTVEEVVAEEQEVAAAPNPSVEALGNANRHLSSVKTETG